VPFGVRDGRDCLFSKREKYCHNVGMAFVDALWAPSSLLLPMPVPRRPTLTPGAAKSARARPLAHVGYVNGQHRAVGRLGPVLRVLRDQELEGALSLLALVEHAGAPA
jgi:hypothetical protein